MPNDRTLKIGGWVLTWGVCLPGQYGMYSLPVLQCLHFTNFKVLYTSLHLAVYNTFTYIDSEL